MFFKKNMAWLESEQAAVPHGYHRQAQVLVSRESLDKSKCFCLQELTKVLNLNVMTTAM